MCVAHGVLATSLLKIGALRGESSAFGALCQVKVPVSREKADPGADMSGSNSGDDQSCTIGTTERARVDDAGNTWGDKSWCSVVGHGVPGADTAAAQGSPAWGRIGSAIETSRFKRVS